MMAEARAGLQCEKNKATVFFPTRCGCGGQFGADPAETGHSLFPGVSVPEASIAPGAEPPPCSIRAP